MRIPIVALVLGPVVLAAAGCGGGGGETAAPTAAKRPEAVGGCRTQAAGAYRVPVADGRVPVILHVPPGTAPGGRWPLVMMLPGAGKGGIDAEAESGESKLADKEGFMVAYPTAAGRSPFWNVSGKDKGKPDDVKYLRTVLQRMTGPNICADPQRLYVTGASNGGGMTAALACAAPDLVAAAAPVAAGYASLSRCTSSKAVPLMAVHSLADKAVPYGGRGADHEGAVDAFLAGWRTRDGCSGAARRSQPAAGVTALRWTCKKAPVVHDRLRDAPHGWYGGDSLDPGTTTVRTWTFFKRFSLDDKT